MSIPVRCLILLLVLTPAATAIAQRLRSDTLVVHFAFDRSTIRRSDSLRIDRYFFHRMDSVKKADPTINGNYTGADSIVIYGYTDTVGSERYNLRLSKLRAQAVLTQAIQFLPQERPFFGHWDGRGKTNPLPGDDSLSRRVEIILFYHLKDTPAVAKAPPVDTPRIKPDDEPDTVFALNNINFIANTPILTDAAKNAMPKSVAYLKTFASHYLEIDGFCNQPGPLLDSREPLFILSVQRAKFIYDYLITQGFDSTHLRYKGMGNATPMVAHPTTAAEMDQNMRVEIKVFRKPQPQPQAQLQQ
jgi:outer membrane protein OmpA-like peptidoglycan-associated protein